MPWQNFEKEALKFIKNKIQIPDLKIEFMGGSNSNEKDIKIYKRNDLLFNLEIKEQHSQIGQFVILPNLSTKSFRLGNLKFNTKRVDEIHKHMNENFDFYKFPTTSGIRLKCTKKMMYNCVKSYCEDHNIQFFISKKKSSDFKIISLENFEKNFDISGIYREKKSGTSYIKDKGNEELKNYIKKKFPLVKIDNDKKGLFLKINNSEKLKLDVKKNRSFIFKEIDVYLSPKKDNIFYVKKKSKTNNATVIFSLEFHNNSDDNDLDILKSRIINTK